MFDVSGIMCALNSIMESQNDMKMQKELTPEDYAAWKKEKTIERRHQEICSAIRSVKNEVTIKRYYY